MKRLATLMLLGFALFAPIALVGCGDDKKAGEPIKADPVKAAAEKAAAEKK
jgi:hypothetical protein